MIDLPLVGSLLVVVAVVGLTTRISPPDADIDVFSYLIPAFLVGIAVGRLAFVAIEPDTVGNWRDLFLVRGGAEFWAGLFAGGAAVVWSARRGDQSPLEVIGTIAPYALIGYATWEATCVVRGGCFGPSVPVGLTPSGFQHPQAPVGLLEALVLAAAGTWLLRNRRFAPGTAALMALVVVAATRAAAGFALPRLSGVTRAHAESIAVAVLAVIVVAALLVSSSARSQRADAE